MIYYSDLDSVDQLLYKTSCYHEKWTGYSGYSVLNNLKKYL